MTNANGSRILNLAICSIKFRLQTNRFNDTDHRQQTKIASIDSSAIESVRLLQNRNANTQFLIDRNCARRENAEREPMRTKWKCMYGALYHRPYCLCRLVSRSLAGITHYTYRFSRSNNNNKWALVLYTTHPRFVFSFFSIYSFILCSVQRNANSFPSEILWISSLFVSRIEIIVDATTYRTNRLRFLFSLFLYFDLMYLQVKRNVQMHNASHRSLCTAGNDSLRVGRSVVRLFSLCSGSRLLAQRHYIALPLSALRALCVYIHWLRRVCVHNSSKWMGAVRGTAAVGTWTDPLVQNETFRRAIFEFQFTNFIGIACYRQRKGIGNDACKLDSPLWSIGSLVWTNYLPAKIRTIQ